MRQLATFDNVQHCQRLCSYLTVKGIAVEVHEETSGLSLWVKNEDQVDAAKAILTEFRAAPESPEYAGHERTAQSLLADAQAKRERAARNMHSPGRDWRASGGMQGATLGQAFRETPLSMYLITAGIVVFLLQRQMGLMEYLAFLPFEEWHFTESQRVLPALADQLPWLQPWRFFTPALLHFGVAHIVFNALCLWNFSRQIERREGKLVTLLLMVVSGVFSNTLQAMMVGPGFGGLSGIAYAMLGFIWIRQLVPAGSGYALSASSLLFALAWFGMGIMAEFQGTRFVDTQAMANYCHGGGLFAGMVIAWLVNQLGGRKIA